LLVGVDRDGHAAKVSTNQLIRKGESKMAQKRLQGRTVAILVTDGFEQVELTEPRKALDEAGAQTRIVSPRSLRVRGWKFTEWGDELPVDVPLGRARPEDFDALLLPGGVMNPDKLRMQPEAVEFVRAFFDAGKPVAAICPPPGPSLKPVRRPAGASPRGRL
jgi:protease I